MKNDLVFTKLTTKLGLFMVPTRITDKQGKSHHGDVTIKHLGDIFFIDWFPQLIKLNVRQIQLISSECLILNHCASSSYLKCLILILDFLIEARSINPLFFSAAVCNFLLIQMQTIRWKTLMPISGIAFVPNFDICPLLSVKRSLPFGLIIHNGSPAHDNE